MTKASDTEELADYVRRVRTSKGLSLNDVARKARQKGKTISSGYVSQIENRYIVSVTTSKLQALAAGLEITEEEIFAVARGKALGGAEVMDAEMALFASRVKKLTPQQKRDFKIAWQMANDLLDRLEKEKEAKAEDR